MFEDTEAGTLNGLSQVCAVERIGSSDQTMQIAHATLISSTPCRGATAIHICVANHKTCLLQDLGRPVVRVGYYRFRSRAALERMSHSYHN